MENLNPITLLNLDYKLIEKVLANRMKLALYSVINEDQVGFMAGRHACTNIRRILELVDLTVDNDIPGVVLSIDFMKCFDYLEIDALIQALKYFQFGESFIQWVKVIYNNPVSCVTNQGEVSNWFKVSRCVKQGRPCSPYFFLV